MGNLSKQAIVGTMLAAIGVATLLAGCNTMTAISGSLKAGDAAKRNGGAIDVRYWDAGKGEFTTTFFDGTGCQWNRNCVLTPPDRTVSAKDTVTLRLLRGYVCDFDESAGAITELDGSPWSPRPGVAKCQDDSHSLFATRGEIAILAKVFERTTGKGTTFQRGELAPSDARLIYYSEDMRESGQPANILNVPLYGPTKYEGHPLSLQLYVVELDDAESKAQRSVLTSLAKLGSAAYPPASHALTVLDKVGAAFLSGQQDDLIFDFLMEFDASSAPNTRPTADLNLPLVEGVYAFVRMEDRNVPVPWTQLVLDHRSGKLKCREPVSESTSPCHSVLPVAVPHSRSSHDVRSREGVNSERAAAYTYFVVEVRRNELEGTNDGFQTFKSLLESPVGDGNSKEMQEAIEVVSGELVADTLFDRARSEAKNLFNSSPVASSRARSTLVAALCAGRVAAPAGGISPHPGAALQDSKIYYLLGLVEQAGKVVWPSFVIKATSPAAATSACAKGESAVLAALF